MRGVLWLSWRHLLHHRVRSGITIACVAAAVFLPVTTQLLLLRYQTDLTARADATPLLAGARGSRFDLTLAALYFRPATLPTVPFAQVRAIGATGWAAPIPLHQRFTAQRHPIVATTPEYYELHRLRAVRGTLPLRLGEVVLGHDVAAALDLDVGATLFSDPTDLYDLSRPPALKMQVCGVLARTGSADDGAVFVDLKTAWILEGLAHGHEDARDADPSLVLAQTDEVVSLGPALRSYQEVTDDNAHTFHVHADDTQLPLTAIIALPFDEKAATLLKARFDGSGQWQMVTPRAVVDDLLAAVLRVKRVLDVLALLLGLSTALLVGLQLLLSMRLRAGEMRTLRRIGCSPGTVRRLHATELALLAIGALLVAAGLTVATLALVPDLVRAL